MDLSVIIARGGSEEVMMPRGVMYDPRKAEYYGASCKRVPELGEELTLIPRISEERKVYRVEARVVPPRDITTGSILYFQPRILIIEVTSQENKERESIELRDNDTASVIKSMEDSYRRAERRSLGLE